MASYITTHNALGQAIFSDLINPHSRETITFPGGSMTMIWSSHIFKPTLDISTESGIKQYSLDRIDGLPNNAICPEDGMTVGFITLDPNAHTMLHRTMTLDVEVMLEGVIELELDSGEKKMLYAGDTVVQRATIHRWRNVTPGDGVARMFGVAAPVVAPVVVGEKKLEMEYRP